MQLTAALFSLLLSGAVALPGTPVQERQVTPTAYAQFFQQGGCNVGQWLEDFTFVQDDAPCHPLNINTVPPYGSLNITGNTLTKTLVLYSLPGCNKKQGNYFELRRGINQCVAQRVESYNFE